MKSRAAVLALAAAALVAGSAGASATVVCNQAGPTLSCSDGTQYHTFGNRTTDNRGRTWLHDRELTIGSNGQIIHRLPGQPYDPSPFAWPPIGTGPLDPQGRFPIIVGR